LPDRNRRWSAAATWRTALGAAALAGCSLLPAAAQATPSALVTCRGSLTKAKPTPDDANLTNYSFHCSGDIQSYTLVVNRTLGDDSTVDDFGTAPTVYNNALTQVSPTQTVDCAATTTPGNGVNCFAVGSTTPPVISAYNWIQGNIDTTDPFCGGLPKGAKAGTTPEPRAVVQLIVTDSTGAEWGPFPLNRSPACPKVKVVKPKPKAKAKHKSTKTIRTNSIGIPHEWYLTR
jgi:hypothetical protein